VKKKITKTVIKYAITLAIGLGIVYIFYSLRQDSIHTINKQYRVLCDAFTVPGLLMIMFGLLIWVSTTGTFDILSYAFAYAFSRLVPGMTYYREEKYYDYVQRKKGQRVKGYSFLFICGFVFLAVAVVFRYLFYNTP
jgi:hypothetical protein